MGILLSILKGQGEANPIDIPIDFNAQPTPDEQQIYQQCAQAAKSYKEYIESIEKYTGCGEFIRQAISSPSKQNDDQAWEAVIPCVAKLKEYYEFAQQLEQLFPKMGNPNIQNDFSYYRRTVSRMKMSNSNSGNIVSDELANRMSLFFAHSNPVTKALIDSVSAGITMIKASVKTIQQYGGNDTNPLLNVVKFSTVHLNAETTPKSTKQLLV
ncbi:Protein fam49a [Terramyces sp. JEL0728]|nr:Protein fam49a [Terramyces sp. JEL0728]